MKLALSQRQHLADMLKDSANVILAALVLAGFVDRQAQWPLVSTGLILYGTLIYIKTALRRSG